MKGYYTSSYPRNGMCAILCEGDISGYEVELLERWTSSVDLVDVWACGTKEAIYGVSDAIGRAVPVFVIEDRDYRDMSAAEKECRYKKKTREDRDIRVGFWRTWERHEIENYLLEPRVVLSTMAAAFQVGESAVEERLGRILHGSVVDEAAQLALSQCRSGLPDRQTAVGGLNRKDARPVWDDSIKRFVAPDASSVAQALTEVMNHAHQRFQGEDRLPRTDELLELFHTKCKEWEFMAVASPVWKIEWAGKEVLQRLRRALSGEFGWPVRPGSAVREPVRWNELAGQNLDGEKDREIERFLQKHLVKAFLDFLNAEEDTEARREWDEILDLLRPGTR